MGKSWPMAPQGAGIIMPVGRLHGFYYLYAVDSDWNRDHAGGNELPKCAGGRNIAIAHRG